MSFAVRFENVTKRYLRGGARYASIRSDLARTFGRLTGRPGVLNGRSALEGVSFEVSEGQSFALVGPNGAGKTTALKLISRILYPSSGIVRVRGRVGALIEVGSGVHPELTARENIWLYGQILGMSKREIRERFDEIVHFADLESVLETPVKMFSSGMQLRLGFSIASHLDPEVLVVDEALAVGDASFQTKCVERMSRLVTEGRTILFVSHNLSAVEAICEQAVFLLDGRVEANGETREVLRTYLEWVDEGERRRKGSDQRLAQNGLVIEGVTVHGADGAERYVYDTGQHLEIRFRVLAEVPIVSPWFSIGVSDGRPGALILCSMLEKDRAPDIPRGRHVVSCRLGPLPLGPRAYELWMSVREQSGVADLINWNRVGAIRIRLPEDISGPAATTAPWMYGPVRVSHSWSVKEGKSVG